ncbi:Folylpolyglutamate synthetase [Kalmanozyma brasiliensis GHG001]|uniref:Tetrahydrofolylpolyglutamate synthase n=1 Tax=Kalmanozyma brasiliensis (strain GHG001) TaxID=1365824 RepID=V5EP11_KALBG|nr:Folylpolyglutamate synthetase [Kalmanozyma brasiliensis GHG001]EST06840.1 Folylpolyglutamate synthetase [Kalmanozyma brasiliensis GHG001]
MPSADPNIALPGGGPASLIILQTHPPLPAFSIPHRVPDPSTDISSFKLSILRILTGQTNAQSSTKPLTFSEEVKEKAINGWKMQMLTLELRQRDDLDAEEEEEDATDSTEMRGFELQDHHECSLIEEGDMIVVRLKPNHTLEELELPKLGSNHRYSAPTGSLTRAGTLSEPPPYSIIQPSEPSSFSSSVGAQPNANYHQHRFQDYRSAFRVVTAANVGSGRIRRSTPTNTAGAGPTSLGNGLNLLQTSGKGSGNKGKRRTSSSAVPKTSASPKLGSSAVLPDAAPATTSTITTASSTSANPSTVAIPASTIDQQHVASPPTSPLLDSGAATPLSNTRKTSSSIVTLQAAQRSTAPATSSPNPSQLAPMPATALVIGPGVQGQVGRNPASVSAPIGSYGGAEVNEYGNAKGLANFTSASGSEIKTKPRRKSSRQNSQEGSSTADDTPRRKPSNPSAAAADAAERRAALARRESAEATPKRPVRDRQASSSSRINKADLPTPPVLPPIQNLAPFPESPSAPIARKERELPPMPTDEPDTSTPNLAVSTPTESKPPRLSFLRKFSSASRTDSTPDSPAKERESIWAPGLGLSRSYTTSTPPKTPAQEVEPPIKPVQDGDVSHSSTLSRAERRYQEVQKALAVERERQAEADKARLEEIRERRERKDKEREKRESEAKKRVEEQKWEMWEEVRRRQKGETGVVPARIERLYSGATDEGQARPSAHAEAIEDRTAPAPAAGNGDSVGPRIELGLERITRLLTRLNSPQTRFPVIHVAGTNGKGSTIAYLDSLLRNALDIRTGTFVSPHLVERRDCCKVDGAVIAKDVWRQAQSDVLFADQGLDIAPTASDDGQPLKCSPFELLTAQTFQAFSLLPEGQRPGILLIEVGLGGRLDATNVFDNTQVLASIVCPIDRDHEAFLGSKLEGIAREKAGIVKQDGLCIIADQRLDDTSAVDQLALGPLDNEARSMGARAAGILDSIRNVCMTRNARLVKTCIPWKLLDLPPTRSDKWGSSVDFTPRLGPTLFLSTSGLNPPSTFVAHPHDPVLFSVPVSVERTRANLTGVCMAVQTLSSIARDEVPQDRWEELRTRIMWGLRDDAEANLRVRESIGATHWPGRCSWHTIDGMDVLVDGAHNGASAKALREYVDSCLAARAVSQLVGSGEKGKSKGRMQTQWQVIYIFAFSEGKDYESMVRALLENPSHLVERQNVALTTFSPPEGMPWVRSVELTDGLRTLKGVANTVDVGEMRTFERVEGALEWAKGGQGLVVVAGSLYLVADVYRGLVARGLWSA